MCTARTTHNRNVDRDPILHSPSKGTLQIQVPYRLWRTESGARRLRGFPRPDFSLQQRENLSDFSRLKSIFFQKVEFCRLKTNLFSSHISSIYFELLRFDFSRLMSTSFFRPEPGQGRPKSKKSDKKANAHTHTHTHQH